MRILFNMEGNKRIGMGALYNCATLAQGFRKKVDSEIKFLISRDSEKAIEELFFGAYDTERIDMRDTDSFLNSVKNFNPDIIIQDLLNLERDYMEGVVELGAVIVNIAHRPDFRAHLKADITINLLYGSKDIRCLHGPRYAILNGKIGTRKRIKHIADNLLISFGGSDVNNLTVKLMKMLDRLNLGLHTNVVIGPGFGSKDMIKKNASSLMNIERFTIHENVTDMQDLISVADLAFVSGGRTIYELAAAGTPGIAFAQNELEYGRLKEFEGWGSVLNYGYFKNDKKLISNIKDVILDKPLRNAMSKKGRKLVDGKGTDRIIDIILEARNEKNQGRG